ncbi:nucleotide-diphospho-sugar transferase [uncultured Arcticibacterium sp.]|uniref:nucleotide-diphospho-sugar transferase n=1 Tax=uncultured Arcticibacterium sp. TaxID=2173042 RepID=UPI0030F5169E
MNNFDVPILLLIFNRPEHTFKVFNKIRELKPKTLFIAADGPRNSNEKILCDETRTIAKLIDWDCELSLLFRDENLGCGKAVSSSIDWFFSSVPSGIILEDDCYPTEDFFLFCKFCLEKYEFNDDVFQINGFNQFGGHKESGDYFFTKYPRVWGWATWRSSWITNDFQMNNWKDLRKKPLALIKRFGFIEAIIRYIIWQKYYTSLANGIQARSWGYQWHLNIVFRNGLCIQPEANLITNIGMEGGTNYSKDSANNESVPFGKLTQPIHLIEESGSKFDKLMSNKYLQERISNFKRKLLK